MVQHRRSFIRSACLGAVALTAGCFGQNSSRESGLLIENDDDRPHELRFAVVKTSSDPEDAGIGTNAPNLSDGFEWRVEKEYPRIESGESVEETGFLVEEGAYWVTATLDGAENAGLWVEMSESDDEPRVVLQIQSNGRLSASNPRP